nr:MAG TPA: hypothetical protein [Caudoviricetes sp.]
MFFSCWQSVRIAAAHHSPRLACEGSTPEGVTT